MATPAPALGEIATRPAVAGQGWAAWRGPLLLALGTVAGMRLLLSLWAAFVLARMPTVDLNALYAHVGYLPQPGGLLGPWEREDALWYEKIAAAGYAPNDGTTAFFPLLPLLIRLGSVLTLGNIPLAGILVASLAAVAAFAMLYRLATLDSDTTTAARTVAYVALFPTAFFLYSAFTESLFLALTVGAFWCARRGRWMLVALLAGLSGLTKVQGALIGLPLIVEYLLAHGGHLRVLRRRPAEAAAVAGAGALATLAFFAYTSYVVHDPLSWSTRESLQWQQRVSWPGETLVVAVQKVLSEHTLSINVFDLAVLLGFSGLAVAAFRLRPSYGLLVGVVLVSTWFHLRADFPLVSVSRYVLVAFPCFLVLARWVGRRPRIVHLLLITFWISWLLVWTSQSVRGYWVG